MNINYFFLFVSSCLLMILFLFKPLDIKQQIFEDVPLFNISSFSMYEFNQKGLITLMSGNEATKYEDRYTIDMMNYTDNSKDYVANMKSNVGIYKEEIVYLEGDVIYFREDNLTFETQKATYNKITTIARAEGEYVVYMGENMATGRELEYDNSLKRLKSKDVVAKYHLKEGKK